MKLLLLPPSLLFIQSFTTHTHTHAWIPTLTQIMIRYDVMNIKFQPLRASECVYRVLGCRRTVSARNIFFPFPHWKLLYCWKKWRIFDFVSNECVNWWMVRVCMCDARTNERQGEDAECNDSSMSREELTSLYSGNFVHPTLPLRSSVFRAVHQCEMKSEYEMRIRNLYPYHRATTLATYAVSFCIGASVWRMYLREYTHERKKS